MSAVSSMINKFGGANASSKSQNLSDQYNKHKEPTSPTKNTSSSASLKKSKSSSSNQSNKTIDRDPETSLHEESLSGGDDLLTPTQDESTLDKLSKSAPNLGGALDKNDAGGRKAPDPSGSITSRSTKSSKVSTPKTVRKTAIKASDLGIDLTDISSETLNQAVKKWKAEQKAGAKPDPVGTTTDGTMARGRTPGKDRSKSRSKSRGRDNDTTPPRDGRARSKSRSKYQAEEDSPSKKGTTPRVKKKIIVRRRASMETPESHCLERATPKRQESKDDMSDLLQSKMAVPSAPDLSGDSITRASEDLKSPKQEPSTTKASPEECVDAVLEQMPLSPKRLARRMEMFGPDAVEKQRSTSQSRMAKARADVYEIQKRLKQAGISDEQYRSMLAAGLNITLA